MMRAALAVVVAVGCVGLGCRPRAEVRQAPTPTSPSAGAQAALPEVVLSQAERTPDVVYVPTPQARVEAMLEMASPQRGDKLYDLGCGDGRIPVTAAQKYGIRAVCVDIDPERIKEARENVRNAGVEDLVEVRQADLFEVDLSDADIVTLYLLPSLNEKLRPKLAGQLRPGARVVSHAFDMGSWVPDETREVEGGYLYKWTIPE